MRDSTAFIHGELFLKICIVGVFGSSPASPKLQWIVVVYEVRLGYHERILSPIVCIQILLKADVLNMGSSNCFVLNTLINTLISTVMDCLCSVLDKVIFYTLASGTILTFSSVHSSDFLCKNKQNILDQTIFYQRHAVTCLKYAMSSFYK